MLLARCCNNDMQRYICSSSCFAFHFGTWSSTKCAHQIVNTVECAGAHPSYLSCFVSQQHVLTWFSSVLWFAATYIEAVLSDT
jgi:hypothetical protein